MSLFESIILEAAVDDMRDRFHANHGLHPEVFNHLYHNALPANNKSLGDMEWLANREVAGEGVAENHEHVRHVMTEFAKPAIKAKLQKKKANQYKTFSDLEAAVQPHMGTAPTKAEMEDEGTKIVHQSDTHIVRQHLNQESMLKAAKLSPKNPKAFECNGKATWCVSAESELGKHYYDSYTKQGKHPFYTIEHTDKHPTMPNRKFAVLVDPDKDIDTHEFRDETQYSRFNEPAVKEYINNNHSIMHTPPGKYIDSLVGGYYHIMKTIMMVIKKALVRFPL
jgi:hypothetical protein